MCVFDQRKTNRKKVLPKETFEETINLITLLSDCIEHKGNFGQIKSPNSIISINYKQEIII